MVPQVMRGMCSKSGKLSYLYNISAKYLLLGLFLFFFLPFLRRLATPPQSWESVATITETVLFQKYLDNTGNKETKY